MVSPAETGTAAQAAEISTASRATADSAPHVDPGAGPDSTNAALLMMAKSITTLSNNMQRFMDTESQRAPQSSLAADPGTSQTARPSDPQVSALAPEENWASSSDQLMDFDSEACGSADSHVNIALSAQQRPVHNMSDSEDDDVVDEINNLIAANVNPSGVADPSADDMGFLDSMAQDFESDEQLGPAINPKVAAIIQSSFTKKISEDKTKNLTDAYPRPQNCNALTSVKVNAEIWARMKPDTRSKDLKLQKTQSRLHKAAMALATLAETLLTDQKVDQHSRSKSVKSGVDWCCFPGATRQTS